MALIFHLLSIKKNLSHLTLNLRFGVTKERERERETSLICAKSTSVTTFLSAEACLMELTLHLFIHSRKLLYI
jgi:hypothetical protein